LHFGAHLIRHGDTLRRKIRVVTSSCNGRPWVGKAMKASVVCAGVLLLSFAGEAVGAGAEEILPA
jgi:hypothetical protein